MSEYTGWLLDLYPDKKEGVVLWLASEDGERHRFHHSFPVIFYVTGTTARLRELWKYLQSQSEKVELARTQRRELFSKEPLDVLQIQVPQTNKQTRLFQNISQMFPELTYFDADIPIALRYAAVFHTFPLARCKITADEEQEVQDIEALETPWTINPEAPPLRILRMSPDEDPNHKAPSHLLIDAEQHSYRLALEPSRPLLINLRAIFNRHDPDLILTTWGDTWLLPYLLEHMRAMNIVIPLNRDHNRQASFRPERSYFSYGQVIYRGKQVHLYGRCHIDCRNAMLWDSYEMEGSFETARVTGLPLQTAARVSPGTGISAMQMLTALRQGILVPWHKQQSETPKTALDMFMADQGGMVYQPLIGLHHDVAEIDFVSMYPGIMVNFNISPETVHGKRHKAAELAPIETLAGDSSPGLVPQTLAPLLEKRLVLKTALMTLPTWSPKYPLYKARASAHKWLLVTCFGYLGYKNARFGRIESHEAVTAYGREALLRAKEAAEDMGFTVLHMYVDGMWVKKPGVSKVADLQSLLDEITDRTHLPIALEGIYRWVAFLPSRQNKRVPVPNRYFGTYQNGTLKIRGIEARRGDAPAFVAETQMQILRILSQDGSKKPSIESLQSALALVHQKLKKLRAGRMPLEDLIVSQRLSRELENYRQPSPPARAATQLAKNGRVLRAGQRVRFLYTLGEPGVYAWDLPDRPKPEMIDIERYSKLMLRAAHSVLEPFGYDEAQVSEQISEIPAQQLKLPLPSRFSTSRSEWNREFLQPSMSAMVFP